jgi:hypothetical protein
VAHVEVLGNLLFIEEAVVATAYIDKLAEPVEVYSGDGDAKVVGKAGRHLHKLRVGRWCYAQCIPAALKSIRNVLSFALARPFPGSLALGQGPHTTASGDSFSWKPVFLGCLPEESLMRKNEARTSCASLITARLHGPHRASVIAIALFVFSGMLQASGQTGITVTPATISATVLQSVPGTCSNYQSNLATTGVQASETSHPGTCTNSVFVPLFNGQALTNDWRQILLGLTPSKFQETVQIKGKQTCIAVSKFVLDLSASVRVSQLDPTTVTSVGPVCSNELNRVKAASALSAQTLKVDADKILHHFALTLQRQQSIVPVCGPNRDEAQLALYQEIWGLLKTIAQDERNAWHDPESGRANQCVPQCVLCSAGWVGTITCTKTIRDSAAVTNYTWDETQTWIVGGTPQQQMGGTVYPATFTAGGGGHKNDNSSQNGISWTVNDTSQGSLKVSGTQQMPTFQTSQITITHGITSSPTGYEADETAYQLQPFTLSPNTHTDGSTTVPPNQLGYQCATPQKPGSASCQVDCTWTLAFQ